MFIAPKVDPGDVVMLLSSPDDPTGGYLAMVTQVNYDSIDVVQLGGRPRQVDAVRHKDDPWHKEHPEEQHFCWMECAKQKRIAEIERVLAELVTEVTSLRTTLRSRLKAEQHGSA